MTERDLRFLKDMAIPPAREDARRSALEAALEAFDQDLSALPADSAKSESEAPNNTPPKGNVVPFGQTETSNRKRRFFRMDFSSRKTQAIAASVAALVVVAPLAFNELTKSNLPNPGTFSTVTTEVPVPGPKEEPAALAETRAPAEQPRGGEDRRYDEPGKPQIAELAKAPEPAQAPPPPAATASPAHAPPAPQSDRFTNADVEERVAEMEATTARKGNRKVEIAVVPDPNIPAEISVGLGGAAKDGALVVAQTPSGPKLRAKEIAKSEATVRGQISAGKKSLGADNAALGTDFSETLQNEAQATAPPASVAAPAQAVASLDAASPKPASSLKQNLNAAIGRRMLDSEKYKAEADLKSPHDPYAWMGHADEQKAIALEENRDHFESKEINAVKQVAAEPVSTFSVDVDTASYAFVRRALNAGHLPPKDAVRVEEMINYFPYNYPAPESVEVPFKPTVTVTNAPWNAQHKLVHVALQGYELKNIERPRANLVFLIDVSGSMEPADRLPLVKNAFRMLVDELRPDDTVGIVTYASGSGVLLEPTRAAEKYKILSAIDQLGAGGSTAGAAGIADAYRLAESNFEKNAVNRVILATDGDFNVGMTNQDDLKSYIERKRQSGIFLSILGVGQGNLNDALMQTLAQNGNGTAAYADTLSEARKVLVEESSSTLFTIAKDVKAQIEWNPAFVSEYRLIGYETRSLKREDFNNDRVDAGDIGSGHRVTAIYEVTPVGAPKLVEDLRYGKKLAATDVVPPSDPGSNSPELQKSVELGFLKLRYKRPSEDVSKLIEVPIVGTDTVPDTRNNVSDVRFSIAVAAFGQMLKGEPYTLNFGYDDVLKLAQDARGEDRFGYRAEFLNLVRLAKSARP